MKSKGMVRRVVALGLLFLAAGACDSMGPGEERGPGVLTATLRSPHGDEGSAVFRLEGGIELGVISTPSGQVFYQHAGTSSRVVVVLDDPGEILFQVQTGDRSEPPIVTVLQVADGDDALRPSLDGYTVDLGSKTGLASSPAGGRP